jgi:hypothetical protein
VSLEGRKGLSFSTQLRVNSGYVRKVINIRGEWKVMGLF